MALALHRNTETGELIELNEDWLTRFPKDPYTLVGTDELAKAEAERRQADIAAIGARPFDEGDGAPTDPAPTPAAAGRAQDDDEDDDRTSTSRSRF